MSSNSQNDDDDVFMRDFFASQALAAFSRIENPEGYAVMYKWTPESIAKKCYLIADAFMVEREKRK